MSDDLISRKALIEKLKKWCGKQRYLIPENVWELIETEPVSFDKEKVIEELENYLFEKYCVEGDSRIDEIVEKGGIE